MRLFQVKLISFNYSACGFWGDEYREYKHTSNEVMVIANNEKEAKSLIESNFYNDGYYDFDDLEITEISMDEPKILDWDLSIYLKGE